MLKVHFALCGTETEAGEGVNDNPQPGDAAQVVRPSMGTVAVHLLEEIFVARLPKDRLNFNSKCRRLVH